jgi:uncharacterized protein with von Willebrand factor type A (vWA) domain
MTTRFTYSRWDGTQKGFEVDAESLLEAVTDDLLYHGDVNSALRRLMQQGLTDRNGERIEGMRDMMNKIRERREELLDRSDLGGVYSEISEALDDIIDEGDKGGEDPPPIVRVDLQLRNRELSTAAEVQALLAEIERRLSEPVKAGLRVRLL